MNKTVVIGLSGGVDSSVAASILKKKGYNVIGAFMKNFSDTKNPYTKECSYLEDKRIAQKIANHLKIEFVTFDFEKEYKKFVIDTMYSSYKKGLTPNPDILCNKIIKFPLFWKEAKKLGADYIAMGHYAKIKKVKSKYELHMGKDNSKDQSYFLANLSQNDLKHTLFPLGDFKKEHTRKIAKKNRFPNWDRHGSVGICFVGQVDMQSFLKKKINEKIGNVKDSEGKIIGKHKGISFYTIGQKAGEHIGIEIKKPKELSQKKFYIAKKLKDNTLVIVPEGHDYLFKREINLKDIHKIDPKEKINNKKFKIRIRHLGKLHDGKLVNNKVILDKPLDAISPGQILVMYDKKRLVASAQISN